MPRRVRPSVSALTVLVAACFCWELVKVALNTVSPVCVVRSGSMRPSLVEGDVVVITNFTWEKFTEGDIVVFKLPGIKTPIVHRILKISSSSDILTKGDANTEDDESLYRRAAGLRRLDRTQILGRVRLLVPRVGMLRDWYQHFYKWLLFPLRKYL